LPLGLPVAGSAIAIDLASRKARLKDSTDPMSGHAAPARTAMPIVDRATAVAVSGKILS